MGSWRLEVGRMLLYLTFPIGIFVLFNTPYFYEKSMRGVFESYSETDITNLRNFEKLKAKKEFEELQKTVGELEK